MPGQNGLPFEKEIHEMEELLAKLESSSANGQAGASDEIRRMRRELTNLIRKIYTNLSAWDTIPPWMAMARSGSKRKSLATPQTPAPITPTTSTPARSHCSAWATSSPATATPSNTTA